MLPLVFRELTVALTGNPEGRHVLAFILMGKADWFLAAKSFGWRSKCEGYSAVDRLVRIVTGWCRAKRLLLTG